MPTDLVKIISDLLSGGLPVLLLYLYFQERMGHKDTRDKFVEAHKVLTDKLLQVQTDLYEARIADYKTWLEFQNDIIISGRLSSTPERPIYPPENIPTPTPKTQPKSRALD